MMTFDGSNKTLALSGTFATIRVTLVDESGARSEAYLQQIQFIAPVSTTTIIEEPIVEQAVTLEELPST